MGHTPVYIVVALAVPLAAVLLWRRWVYVTLSEKLLWARHPVIDKTRSARELLGRTRRIRSDSRLGPAFEALVARCEARCESLEPRYRAADRGLLSEYPPLRAEAERLGAAVEAIEALLDAAAPPRMTVEAIELRASGQQQARELRTRLDRLESRRADLERRLLAEGPWESIKADTQELTAGYRVLQFAASPLWQKLHPEEAKARADESAFSFEQFLEFQRTFRERQERDHAELRRIDEQLRDKDDTTDDALALLDRIL